MSIHFDPKGKTAWKADFVDEIAKIAEQEAGEIQTEENGFGESESPRETLGLLFQGLRRRDPRQQQPADPVRVPDLRKEILKPLGSLGKTKRPLKELQTRYVKLRDNLSKRRANYQKALETPMSLPEARDLQERIAGIDRAIRKAEAALDQIRDEMETLDPTS